MCRLLLLATSISTINNKQHTWKIEYPVHLSCCYHWQIVYVQQQLKRNSWAIDLLCCFLKSNIEWCVEFICVRLKTDRKILCNALELKHSHALFFLFNLLILMKTRKQNSTQKFAIYFYNLQYIKPVIVVISARSDHQNSYELNMYCNQCVECKCFLDFSINSGHWRSL